MEGGGGVCGPLGSATAASCGGHALFTPMTLTTSSPFGPGAISSACGYTCQGSNDCEGP